MIRNRPTATLIATALVAALALAGCKKKEEAAVVPPADTTTPAPAPAPEPAPAPAPMASVTSVDLGNAVGADNKVTAPATTFAKTDKIHASVATDGPGGNLNAKWSFQDGQQVNSEDKTVPAGPQVSDFAIEKPDGWPVGKYKVEISLDGTVVQTREFEIK